MRMGATKSVRLTLALLAVRGILPADVPKPPKVLGLPVVENEFCAKPPPKLAPVLPKGLEVVALPPPEPLRFRTEPGTRAGYSMRKPRAGG